MAQSSHAACKLLYILDACWPFHVGDGRDLVGVGFDATSADDVAQQYSGWNSKDALWRVQLSLILFQVGESFFEVGDVIIGSLGLDDHIIDVCFDVVAYLLIEAHLDGPLVGHLGIFESEVHGGIAIHTKRHDERRLDLVVFLEGYLVIAGVTIEEGEQFVAGGGVYNLIYPR